MIKELRYRKDIDGLRGVAILSVVFFHAGFGIYGGYVGVDVFFVISGFLITSLIWNHLENGRFTFADFWERRARRIVPALVLVTVATLVAGWFLLLPSDYQSLGWAATAQAIFGANFYYWLTSGYFDGAATEKPLIHTWSIAVEEQFYLLAPVLLWLAYRLRIFRGRGAVLCLVAAGLGLSFCLSVHEMEHSPEATFYLLPTRAWELLCGSFVAFLPPALLAGRRFLREILALTGLELILITLFTYNYNTPFPGVGALMPCVGTALIIWGNGYSEPELPTLVGRFLSMRPLVFIGLISYSLYLWHWPFLAFGRYTGLDQLSQHTRFVMVAAGFLCAILSWKYVETPFRKRWLGPSRKSIFIYAGASLAGILAFGLLCGIFQGFPQRLRQDELELASAKFDSELRKVLTTEDIKAGKLLPLGVPGSTPPTVLVWGDSHAQSALPGLNPVLKEKGATGVAAIRLTTPPVIGWCLRPGPEGDTVKAYNAAVLSYIQTHHIADVILISRWSYYIGGPATDPQNGRTFDAALLATVRALLAAGCRPWIVLDVPTQKFDVPRALSLPIYSQAYVQSQCARVSEIDQLDSIAPNTIADIKKEGGRVIDPKPRFLDPTGHYYTIQKKDVVLYRDFNHLTRRGAILLLRPFFQDSLDFTAAH